MRACLVGAAALSFGIGLPFGSNDRVHWLGRMVLVLLALVTPLVVPRMSVPRIAAHLVGGAVAGATTYIFATGPGNLWPIAIVYFAFSAAGPVAMGSVGAFLLRRIGTPGSSAAT